MKTKQNSLEDPIIYPTKDEVQEMIDMSFEPFKHFIERKKAASIHKVEEFNDETIPEQREKVSNIFDKYTYEDRIFSARNAAKILPPNLLVDGRHTPENISALCGFNVVNMMDDIYADLVHDEV
jgi:hypothetical protein